MKHIALVFAGLVAGAMPLAAQHARHFPPPQPAVQPPTSIPVPPAPSQNVAQADAHVVMDPTGMMDTMELLLSPALRFAPRCLLGRGHDLLLTPDQVRRLTAIDDSAAAARAAVMPGYVDHIQRLREVLAAAEPDTSAADAHFQAIQAGMSAVHRAQLHAALAARDVLTDEQRRRVEGAVPPGPPQDGAAAGGHASRPGC